jgi:hypothetical protein
MAVPNPFVGPNRDVPKTLSERRWFVVLFELYVAARNHKRPDAQSRAVSDAN